MDEAADAATAGAAGGAAAAATGTAAAATDAGATTASATGAAATTGAAAATTDKGAAGTTAAATGDTAKTGAAAATNDASKGEWPDNWQTLIAGDDKDELKQIGRYASPKAVWEKARALERRLSSGELKAVLPKDAKPDEINAWRKDNGIPLKVEDYKLDLSVVKEIPKESKPVIDAFLKSAHATNLTNEQASAAVDSYFAIQQQQAQVRAEQDETARVTALDALNKEFGGAFRRNINMVDGLLQKLPESVRENVKGARMPDGSLLFNNVDAVRGFLAIALENNPAGVLVPAGGGDIGKTALEEYAVIQKTMREQPDAYKKNAGMQERTRELIDYLSKQGLIDNNGNVIQQKKAA